MLVVVVVDGVLANCNGELAVHAELWRLRILAEEITQRLTLFPHKKSSFELMLL